MYALRRSGQYVFFEEDPRIGGYSGSDVLEDVEVDGIDRYDRRMCNDGIAIWDMFQSKEDPKKLRIGSDWRRTKKPSEDYVGTYDSYLQHVQCWSEWVERAKSVGWRP